MTGAPPDPAAIARRLSPAQRRALMILPADGAPAIWTGRGPESWTRRGWAWNVAASLQKRGLVSQWTPLRPYRSPFHSDIRVDVHPAAQMHVDCYALSPLGLSVRAALLAMEAGDE